MYVPRHRFGTGYDCTIETKTAVTPNEIIEFLQSDEKGGGGVSEAWLVEQHGTLLTFRLPGIGGVGEGKGNDIKEGREAGIDEGSGGGHGVTLASVFAALEGAKERLGIVDYSISQVPVLFVFSSCVSFF